MSTIHTDDNKKNAPYRGDRRAARRHRVARNSGAERRLSVRSEQRDQPDVRKIARAIIRMAVAAAEAEAEAQAKAAATVTKQRKDRDADA